MKDPNIISVLAILHSGHNTSAEIRPGVWVPARPLGFWGLRYRLRATWLVWTGQADALTWPGQ